MDAILFGPCIGELYWECGRFAPILPYYKLKKYPDKKIKYIILTRQERFDLYGKYADILIPLKIKGDYKEFQPNCFRLDGYKIDNYLAIAKKFKESYSNRFNIIEHIYPNISKSQFLNKSQFDQKKMVFKFKPRNENFVLVDKWIKDDKPIVLIAPRYRVGFRRNWNKWQEFYDILAEDNIREKFNFIICGKKGEYIPDNKNRFYDMNEIDLTVNSSTVGILMALLERCYFVFGSQSAIPNMALLYRKEVLEFGHQKNLHSKIYNIFNTPITFIDDPKYNIDVMVIFSKLKEILGKKEMNNGKRMDNRK